MLPGLGAEDQTKRPGWFWAAIIYLVATVTYNLWCWAPWIYYYRVTGEVDVASNLVLKILAIGLLIYRRGEGVYLLAIAFIIGLSGTLWGIFSNGYWDYLPLLTKISRINGFVISLAIVLYMGVLKKRGFLSGRTKTKLERDRLQEFD